MKLALAVVLASAAACGPSLNPALGGGYYGEWTQTLGESPSQSHEGPLTLAVSGQTLTVSGICPDGSTSIKAIGSGESASWMGTLACPATTVGSCAAAVVTFTSVKVYVEVDDMNDGDLNQLSLEGAGNYSGCGTSASFTYSFDGWGGNVRLGRAPPAPFEWGQGG